MDKVYPIPYEQKATFFKRIPTLDITHQDIQANGLRFHVALCGPEDGPAVILLHGFPEFWGGWATHMPMLARQGFRVIAPDLRGYGTSEKPKRVKDYALKHLVEDVAGILDVLGHPTAYVVGHDWGGALAWEVARTIPERVERLVVINCPPVDVLQRSALGNPMQILRSWYTLFFQMPFLPQWSSSLGNHKVLCSIMIRSAVPGTFTHESLAAHRDAWSNPGAIRSMIHWYRAALRHAPKGGRRISVPALLLWGEGDRFLGTPLIEPTAALCDSIEVVRFPDNTHWLPHEQPEVVVNHMVGFFDGTAARNASD